MKSVVKQGKFTILPFVIHPPKRKIRKKKYFKILEKKQVLTGRRGGGILRSRVPEPGSEVKCSDHVFPTPCAVIKTL